MEENEIIYSIEDDGSYRYRCTCGCDKFTITGNIWKMSGSIIECTACGTYAKVVIDD